MEQNIYKSIAENAIKALLREGWVFDSDHNARKTNCTNPLSIECLGGSCLTKETLVQVLFGDLSVTLPLEESTEVREAFKAKYLEVINSRNHQS